MTKLVKASIEWDRHKSYAWNLAKTINNYWKLEVAAPVGDQFNAGQALSSMVNGVPAQAFHPDSKYTHPDIVYVRIDQKTGQWHVRLP